MRKPAFAGLLLCALFLGAHSPKVSAETPDILETNSSSASYLVLKHLSDDDKPLPPLPDEPKQVTYTVKDGDTLTSIAKKHDTTWKRLYDKNKKIENPDIIDPGTKIVIPADDEALDKRSLPTTPQPRKASGPSTQAAFISTVSRGSTSGNGYTRGYCTWYAKNRRPDLPNNLGNADTWVYRARAQGIPTGSTPRVGAIGQQGMHVVYVERVNSNGTVMVSEMNFKGWNIVSTRTVAANTFMYIY